MDLHLVLLVEGITVSVGEQAVEADLAGHVVGGEHGVVDGPGAIGEDVDVAAMAAFSKRPDALRARGTIADYRNRGVAFSSQQITNMEVARSRPTPSGLSYARREWASSGKKVPGFRQWLPPRSG